MKPTLAPLSRPQLARRASLGHIPRRPLSASPRPIRRALGRPAATFLGRATLEETPWGASKPTHLSFPVGAQRPRPGSRPSPRGLPGPRCPLAGQGASAGPLEHLRRPSRGTCPARGALWPAKGPPQAPCNTSGGPPPPRAPWGPWYPELSAPPTGVIGRGPAPRGPLAPGSIPTLRKKTCQAGRDLQRARRTVGPRVPALKRPSDGR